MATQGIAYDYIILGAGSAGCVLAARLSESGAHRVLVIEAGGADSNPAIHVPAAFATLFKTDVDWAYQSEPQPAATGSRDYLPRGKVLGGSSSINAMIYMRGHRAIYDRWAAAGNLGWSYDDVLPYFKKSQHQERGASAAHGVGGPLNVADLRDPNPLSLALVEAARELGLATPSDFNAGEQDGFGLNQVTQKHGMRCSAAVAFLHPAMSRANLTVETAAHVTRLVFEGNRCVGVAFEQGGQACSVVARREVIVCAGAYNSPQLLMLSGVGPAAALRALGIPVVKDLPGVGQNLQDHWMVPVAYHANQPITLAAAQSEAEVAKLQQSATGMLTSNVAEASGFVRLRNDSQVPELQFLFGPTWFLFHGMKNPPGHGFTLLPGLVAPRSKGQVTLRSADPHVAPTIDSGALSHPDDVAMLVNGLKIARGLLQARAFDAYRGAEHSPGPQIASDAELEEHVRATVQTIYHPVGTCKMGQDPAAVVDAELRVHGISGLRVADASIMPVIVNANTNAPTIMIGEKAAALILADAR